MTPVAGAVAAALGPGVPVAAASVVVTSSTPLWYLTRATGLVALVLLTGGMMLGLLTSARWERPRWPRFVTVGLHRNVTLLACAFTGAHIATSVTDTFVPIGWADAVVPFVSGYRPLWLGLGAVAFDLLAALTVTSLLRARLRYRSWRAVHWTAYACWPVAVAHGLGLGTDTPTRWVLGLTLACVAAVCGLAAWRWTRCWATGPEAGR